MKVIAYMKNKPVYNVLRRIIVKAAAGLLDMALPPRCPVSHKIVDRQGMLDPAVWAGLNFIAAPVCESCGIPLEFELGQGARCAACLTRNNVYEKSRAALIYDDASRGLILGFKHGDQTHAALSFVPWLRQAGKELIEEADVLAPVPLHRWRLLKRRYNQAGLMAGALGKAAGKPVWQQALLRTRPTPSQGHLKAGERARNVRRAFAVHPDYAGRLAGKNILLIDDVYTTGATVSECAQVLLDAGAARVDVLTLARVARPVALA